MVDFLRSCYETDAKFYPDRLDLSTKIRWFFCEDGQQDLDVPNIFCSRNWRSEGDIETALGEVAGSPRRWVDGASPWVWRDNIYCAADESFTEGQLFSTREDFVPLNWGIPPCCDPGPDPPCPTLFEIGVDHPAVVYTLAVGIKTLRRADTVALDTIFETMLGTPHTFRYIFPPGDLYPNVGIAWNDRQVIVLIDGTHSWFQLFVNILGSTTPPIPVGGFRYQPIMYTMAAAIQLFMVSEFVPLDLPIVFAGHSLGGALCHYLLARERQFRPTRRSYAITFGAPKSGDQDMVDFVGFKSFDLRTEGDPVPWLPPDIASQFVMRIPVPNYLSTPWAGYRKTSGGWVIKEDGSMEIDLPFGSFLDDARNLAEALVVGAFATRPVGHDLQTYIDLLRIHRLTGPETPPCTIDILEVDGVEPNIPDFNFDTCIFRNVVFDVYRTGTVPPAVPAVPNVSGLLCANFAFRTEAGEGDAAVGHFSHVMLVPFPQVDIRDDYYEGTRGANYDTVYVKDSGGSTGLVVRFVELVLLGDPAENYLRVYLDRKLPTWPNLMV